MKRGLDRSAIMKYAQIEWNNGTPRSAAFGDVYFSEHNGIEETRYVFLQQNELPQRWLESDRFVIAETGFGTGLNFLVTMQAWLQSAPVDAILHYLSIENRPVSPADIRKLAVHWPELESHVDELLDSYPPPLPGMHLLELAQGRVRLHLIFDEVSSAIAQINYRVDAWYLDGFAPSRNPAMWSARVFELIGRNTRVGGSFATYTAAGDVRRGLTGAGFVVQKSKGCGAKRDMLKGFIAEQRCYSPRKPWYSLPAVTVEHKNAVIIGAGLAGLSCAWSLVRRGWHVTLVDKYPAVAAGASGNPAGLLMPRLTREPSLDACFYANAYLYAIQCLDRLQASASESFWFSTGNVLVDEEARLKQLADRYACAEAFIRYARSESAAQVSGIDIDHDVLLFVNAGWVRVKQLCEQLVQACGDRLVFVHADVTDIRRVNDSWQLYSGQQDRLASTDCVVVANAAAARQFSLLQWLPLRSSRGQLTQVEQTGTSRGISCGISAERYITPAYEGRHIVGASYSMNDASMQLSADDHQRNIDSINRLTGAGLQLDDAQAGRVAFRAVSEDRVPIVGCVADRERFEQDYRDLHHGRRDSLYPAGTYLPGLYVSTAHGSRGLASCFISAEVIASIIGAEPAPVSRDIVDYLNPARFLVRKLKRSRS